jgi:hypothetical protein
MPLKRDSRLVDYETLVAIPVLLAPVETLFH